MIKKRLVDLLAHAKKYIVYQVAWQWLSLLCQIVMIYCAAMLLEQALFREVTRLSAVRFGGTAVLAMALRFACDRGASRASYRASVDVKRILRDKIYEKLLRLGASYREKVTTSEVVQMAAEGVEQLETYFGKYLSQLFYSLLAPVTLFLVLSFVSWKASLVLLICVPLIPISIVAVQKFAKRLLNKYWGIYTELGDSFLENLQGLTTLKIYQSDEQKAREMDAESQKFRQITMKVLTMQLNSTSVMDIIAYGGAAVGMIVTLSQFMQGNLSVHGALMLILLASEFFIPLRLLGSFFHIAMNGMAASDKIFALLGLPEPPAKTETLDGKEMGLEFTKVYFSYEADREILKGVSMEFPAGSFTSIVGTSGCGKSTAAAILMGRNQGYQGSVTIEGKELSQIREDSLMEHITLVSHNSYLFKGTVEDNLRMGKQRIGIARAFLHDAPFILLDEPTSNLDSLNEGVILKALKEGRGDKTVLLVSHRKSTMNVADVVYRMDNGRLS